jgi:chromosome partitioning protein
VVHTTVVFNPKGGSGKTTLATNLASWYAANGLLSVLKDLDAQNSSGRWLAKRKDTAPRIHGISPFNVPAKVTRTFAMRVPPDADRIVVDTPAAVNKHQLYDYTRDAQRIVVPVLPSDIDIQAVTRSIADLLLHGKIQRGDNRLAVVANRVKRNTVVFKALMRFLESLKVPVVAVLRDSQNYVKAASTGVGVHEMKGTRVRADQAQWATLIDWIEHGKVPAQDTPWFESTEREPAEDDPPSEGAGAPSEKADDSSSFRLLDISAFLKRKA